MAFESAQHGTEGAKSQGGLSDLAQVLNRKIEPINRYISYLGAGMLGLLVLMLMYSIIGRRLIGSPLKGSFELTELFLVAITFTVLAAECMGHEKMTVDILSKHLPRRIQDIVAPIIFALVIFMLVVLTWQLIKQGIRVQGFHQTTRVIQIPIYPFLYLAAFGIITLIPVYLVRFLFSLDRAVKK